MPEIKVACANQFSEITNHIGNFGVKLDAMQGDMILVKKAVVGNGSIENSLVYRLGRLEDIAGSDSLSKRKWFDRVWQTAIAIGLVCFGVWIKS